MFTRNYKKIAAGILAGTMLASCSPAQANIVTDAKDYANKTASKIVKKWQGSKALRICGYSSLLIAGLLWPIYDAVNIISQKNKDYRLAQEQFIVLKSAEDEAVCNLHEARQNKSFKEAALKARWAVLDQKFKLINIKSRSLLGAGNFYPAAKIYLCTYLIVFGLWGLKEELWDSNKTDAQNECAGEITDDVQTNDDN